MPGNTIMYGHTCIVSLFPNRLCITLNSTIRRNKNILQKATITAFKNFRVDSTNGLFRAQLDQPQRGIEIYPKSYFLSGWQRICCMDSEIVYCINNFTCKVGYDRAQRKTGES